MANTLRLLTPSEVELWYEALDSVGGGDVFHSPAYIFALGQELSVEPFAVWYQEDSGHVFYPFYRQRIANLAFLEGSKHRVAMAEYHDITSPYGYSGPVALPSCARLWDSFLDAFHRFCADSGIVAEFVRLNPFLVENGYFNNSGTTLVCHPIYVVDLRGDESCIRRQMRKGHRYAMAKAEREGVIIKRMDDLKALRVFWKLYCSTMERNKAGDWYFLSWQFFERIWRNLGDAIELWNASYNGSIIASTLVLQNGRWAHYFLSGTDANYFRLSANHLLLYQIMINLQARGLQSFNLGGGYRQEDGLSRFKRGFTHHEQMFCTCRRVHLQDVYDKLCDLRFAFGQPALHSSNYFPAYRA